ncbi:MAG: glycosyltransferase family 39 protein [Ignavibacterium sp.]
MKKYRDSIIWFFVSAIVLFTLSFVYLSSPPHSDERHFIETIKLFTEGNLISTIKDYPEITPPLFYILFSVWTKISGFSIESLRILNVLISLLCWQLIFYFFKTVTKNFRASFLLTALIVFNPYFIGVSIFVYNDNLMLLFIMLGVLSFIKIRSAVTDLFFALGILVRQYLIIFPLSVFIYSLLQSILSKKLRVNFLIATALSVIPIFFLFIYWQGFAPESGLKIWYVKNRSLYNLDYINTYLTFSTVYILPLIIYYFHKRKLSKLHLIYSLILSVILSLFPVQPSLATVSQTKVTTVGYVHKFLAAIFGMDSILLNVLLFILLLAGCYITMILVTDLIKKFQDKSLDYQIIFSLLWISFLIIMPFSFQVWEKYLIMILPFYAAAIYTQIVTNVKNEKVNSSLQS